eukprot:TRINITY_DN10632_c0_g1_i1.p2 TRINITY_DN10632_c0_g1~~TRINITY_DN10632_c0_g1_i1.p2  ORF type:complete len:167 (-),score=21.40 TRINITY_DN10632_c0_g1_i1:251-751(-)
MMCSFTRSGICFGIAGAAILIALCSVEVVGILELMPALIGAFAYLILHLQGRRQKANRRSLAEHAGARKTGPQAQILAYQGPGLFGRFRKELTGAFAAQWIRARCCVYAIDATRRSFLEASSRCRIQEIGQRISTFPQRLAETATAVLDWCAVLVVHAEVIAHLVH